MLIPRRDFELALRVETSIPRLCKVLNNLGVAAVHPEFRNDIEQIEEMVECINKRIYEIITKK